MYSGDLNIEHLNNKLLLVQLKDIGYSNGSLVFRPLFENKSGIQMEFE